MRGPSLTPQQPDVPGEEALSTFTTTADHPDKVRKRLPCLGCGEAMWTDRCHRICKKCRRRNDATPATRVCRTALPSGTRIRETSGIPFASDY